jgi:hypothetical protein
VDAAGAVERPVRTTAESAPRPPDAQRYAALIARLREAREGNADAAWLERELEHAAKQRAVLAVEVAMPDGTARELVLEVTGFGGACADATGRATSSAPCRSARSSPHVRSRTPNPEPDPPPGSLARRTRSRGAERRSRCDR